MAAPLNFKTFFLAGLVGGVIYMLTAPMVRSTTGLNV